MADIDINWCKWSEIINERFEPLVENTDRYIIAYGGRGSSKSDWAAKKLIYRCLSEKYFRYVLVRNTYATIKDSSYQTIKDIIHDLGLESLFRFKIQPLEIECMNGNKFLARGCDDATKLKSIKDPTGVWWEEDVPDESDFITITTSVRTSKADYLQEIFTINPEVEGNYQENWFWKRFFKGHIEKSFSDVTVIQVEELKIELTYTVHHSWHKDNRWLPNAFVAQLMQLKIENPYYYTIYCNGEWGNKQTGGLFYKHFDRAKSVDPTIVYNPDQAIHLSFDFNVNPYMSATIWQIDGKTAKCIDEIASVNPDNTTVGVCREFERRYFNHKGGLFIYGDPSGRQQDTRTDKGYNDYTIIFNELEKYHPIERVANKHPPVVTRGNFINTVFLKGFNDLNILFSDKCKYMLNDMLFGKEASDGTKLKEKTKVDGVTFEKYFHHADTMDYFLCEAFINEFEEYQHGSTPVIRSYGANPTNKRKTY